MLGDGDAEAITLDFGEEDEETTSDDVDGAMLGVALGPAADPLLDGELVEVADGCAEAARDGLADDELLEVEAATDGGVDGAADEEVLDEGGLDGAPGATPLEGMEELTNSEDGEGDADCWADGAAEDELVDEESAADGGAEGAAADEVEVAAMDGVTLEEGCIEDEPDDEGLEDADPAAAGV